MRNAQLQIYKYVKYINKIIYCYRDMYSKINKFYNQISNNSKRKSNYSLLFEYRYFFLNNGLFSINTKVVILFFKII